jgi:predicted dehydrogenase
MISVGLIGTSWFSDVLYLPALNEHPDGKITAICGRNRARAQELADKWHIPHVYTDYNALIESGHVQALIIATPNDLHYPITVKALEFGLHVLCEKPLALNYREAKHMADLAEQKGVKQFVPFTWSFMPTFRYLKALVDSGYIGKPYHLNMRWYMDFWRGSDYMWRMDKAKAGSGALGDLGSHYLYLADWLFGKISSVSCQLGQLGQHPKVDLEGKPFEQTDDTAVLMLQFENGAKGVLDLSVVAYKENGKHDVQLHGSDGTLHGVIDGNTVQQVTGAKAGEDVLQILPIPDPIWGGARQGNFMETFEDVFRKQDFMARDFISSIAANRPVKPDFRDGAYIQRVIDAAIKSDQERCWVDVEDIK